MFTFNNAEYKGFDTKDFVDKKGTHRTIKILKFDKI